MTKKDFELIANVIAGFNPITRDRGAIARDFADALAATNPRFDRDKFIYVACGRSAAEAVGAQS